MVYKHAISTVVPSRRFLITVTTPVAVPAVTTIMEQRAEYFRATGQRRNRIRFRLFFLHGEPAILRSPLIYLEGIRLFDRYDAGEQAVLVHIYLRKTKIWKISRSLNLWSLPPCRSIAGDYR